MTPAVSFVDAIQNRVLLTLESDLSEDIIRQIASKLSRENQTVVQIFLYEQRVLTVSVA
jgi:hypothetical protein